MRNLRWRGILLTVVLGAAGLLGLGFLSFVVNLPDAPVPAPRADGIVVLTGSAARINDGLDLLAAGQGKRLLISGVNPVTRTNELARLTPAYRRLFDCCVDVGRAASNTIGNAIETRDWVRKNDFRSIIVVTSDFHMRRAMAEIARESPGVTLVPFPVVSERMRNQSWWTNPTAARLLFWEYLKFVVVKVRLLLQNALD